MKKHATAISITLLLILSAGLYALQLALFRDARDTRFYLLQDLAFLPVQIAVVTIVVGKIINAREKRDRVAKTKMLAGTFFSELGNELLGLLLPCAENRGELTLRLQVGQDWKPGDFQAAAASLREMRMPVSCPGDTLEAVKALLLRQRMSILVLSSNPALLEHEDFTDMLWAVFHLSDELTARGSLSGLAKADAAHLNADAERVLRALLLNWLCHMDHIRSEYPYLFLLAVQQNPLAAEKN